MGKLNFVDPVPADIEIAQSVTPTDIAEIARQLDIAPADFEPHGTTKAKVRLPSITRIVLHSGRCVQPPSRHTVVDDHHSTRTWQVQYREEDYL